MKTSCWVLTEKGLKGTENQCIALAEAAGLSYTVKGIKLNQPWKSFTPWIRCFSPAALTSESDALNGPWPDVVIASGRKAIAPALWIKKQSNDKTKLVIIQSPVIKSSGFDMVVVPKNDQYRGKNILEITGALSIITPSVLQAAKEEWRTRLEKFPAPRLAVMIGGNSRTHKMSDAVTQSLATQLKDLAKTHSLMITASRRTPDNQQKLLRQEVTGPNVFFWDGTGDNPYRGFLAWADALIVTEDSVSMACEAVATGKPVYIIGMEGGSKRFRRFHDYLVNQNYARWFKGKIESWSYIPPDDLGLASRSLQNLLK